MEGSVKWFNRKKGFGFIQGDDNEDYFVHFTAVAQGTFLRDNDRVAFEPVDTDKGKQARNVTLLQKGSEITAAANQENIPSEEQNEEQIEETEGSSTEPLKEESNEEQVKEIKENEEGMKEEENSEEEKKEE